MIACQLLGVRVSQYPATMLHRLPTDIAVETLQLLPLRTLALIPLISRSWKAVIDGIEDSVFRHAAIHRGYINSPALSLQEALATKSRRAIGLCVTRGKISAGR